MQPAGIRLGLDLRGGTHLILQVHVEDAVAAETDQTVDRLKQLLRRPGREISYDEIRRREGTSQILVRGIPPEQSGEFRELLNEQFSTIWDYASGANNEWNLRMKQIAVLSIQDDTVKQSVETIRRRVDGKGLKEPAIQPAWPRRARDPGAVARRGRPGRSEADHAGNGHAGD